MVVGLVTTLSTQYLFIITTLTSTNYIKYSWCVSSVHICMAPGIEPGNLIRSTLIRYPPGPFLLKLSNKVTGET